MHLYSFKVILLGSYSCFAKLHQLGYDCFKGELKNQFFYQESIKSEIPFPLTVFPIRDRCSPCTRSHERAGLPRTGPFSY
jgi:hypothetical protein